MAANPPQTPETLLDGAIQYQRAAQILMADRDVPLIALGSVSAHCVEIALKAALLSSGCTEAQLRAHDLGHNLEALWQLAVTRGIPLDEDIPFWVRVLAIAHGSPYMFRYSREGWGVALPQRRELEPGLQSLLDVVIRYIDRAA